MKSTVFTGAATAMITPMNEQGIDYDSFGRLIDWQIEEGIDAIVVAGTTGEGPTLDDAEHKALLKYAVKRINGRIPMIAGTGSNDTAYSVELTKYACDIGADAMLMVTPYYNKATQTGLIRCFEAAADVSDKPIILYNVPSRTGCNIAPETCRILSQHPMICGIKEASGNISQVAQIASLVDEDFAIYSGNDDQIVPILSLGGKGVISVLSNLMPRTTGEICRSFFRGDIDQSRRLQLRYLELINTLFCEVNPIPVKAAMAKLGFGENILRLPLTQMEEKNAEKLYRLLKDAELL